MIAASLASIVYFGAVVVGKYPSCFAEGLSVRAFAELSRTEKSIEVVRWLCVVPAAWVAGMAPRFIEALVRPPVLAQLPGTPRPPVSDFQRIYLPHLMDIVMAAAFVIAGAKMAPRRRLLVALILSALWMLYAFMVYVLPHASYELRYLARLFTATAAVVAATAYIWYSEKRNRI